MPPNRRILVSLTALVALSASSRGEEAAPAPTAEQVRFFEAKVRPLLVDQCVKCHGPDKQKSGLRLDSRASAVAGGEQGAAVVPGKPEESLLVTAVRHDDDMLKMPPSKKLSAEQVADLTRWVAIGAPWPGSEGAAPAASAPLRKSGYQITDKDRAHWAFQPVTRPVSPATKTPGWVRNPVDSFILHGLEARGLHPNAPASKTELIRRACYDLTGLPPTPREVESFLHDNRPDAYERLVDRLLDSPRYGEKWGRHWLDLVRFAETNSYERDNPKPSAWRYRDYVIRSFNDDKPYDRFVREQIAGDEAYPGDVDALIATGYYRLGIWDDEPTDRVQAYYDGLDDIVATTGQVFLGLTVDCARCHDHKLDPIPQKDYYKLVAFFRNINHFRNGGPTDEAPIFVRPGSKEAYEARLLDLQKRRDEVQDRLTALENQFLAADASGGSADVRRHDLDELRYRFYRDTFDRLPVFENLKPENAGDLPLGLFDLTPRTRDSAFAFVFEGTLIVPEDGEYTFHLDSDDGSRLTVAGRTVIEYDGIHREGEGKSATVSLPKGRQAVRLDYFQMGRGLGLSVSWSGPGFKQRPLSASPRDARGLDVVVSMKLRGEKVLGKERSQKYQSLRRELRQRAAETPAAETALVVTESGRQAPDTFVLLRGNPHVQGDKVDPGFLAVLNASEPLIPTPSASATTTNRRAALADWLTAPSNPMTSRVAANRVWQYHFGRGIVRSPNNFGTQGDPPTHPELLNWLASELVAGGWRLKPLHRVLMTSSAYRMSSREDAACLAKDPTNDSYWRFDMRRLTAEEVRDSVLAVCGDLNLEMYGPGIYPEIPREVLAGQSEPGKGWGKSPPREAARRSVYIHVKRSLVFPILESFDLAETDRSSPVRFSTTQPTQALAMLNGKFLGDQAARLAARLRQEAGDDPDEQARLALRLTTGREPSDAEVRRGTDLMTALRSRDGAPAEEALKDFGLVVLNLNEFLYID